MRQYLDLMQHVLDLETLIVKVAREAVADAGLEPKDIDAIYLGHLNAGFVRQEFPSSLTLQAYDEWRFKPATRVENACATGSAAIHQGLNAIAAKKARRVLVVGVEKMTEVTGQQVGECLIRASYLKEEGETQGGFAGIFGGITNLYFQKHGDQSDALARIAAKNHRNGAVNPLAHMKKDLGYEFCRQVSDKNPFVAGPLKRTDCSLVSDGAAAVVLADLDTALGSKKAVVFRAAEQVNDFLLEPKVTFQLGDPSYWRLRVGTSYQARDANPEDNVLAFAYLTDDLAPEYVSEFATDGGYCQVQWLRQRDREVRCVDQFTIAEMIAQGIRGNEGETWIIFQEGRFLYYEISVIAKNEEDQVVPPLGAIFTASRLTVAAKVCQI